MDTNNRRVWWETGCTLGVVRSSLFFFRYSCVRHERLPSSVYIRIGSAEFQRLRKTFVIVDKRRLARKSQKPKPTFAEATAGKQLVLFALRPFDDAEIAFCTRT